MPAFEESLAESAQAVNEVLDHLLPLDDLPEARLVEAMRYATLGGGKRIRPVLVLAGARLFGVAEICALRVGAAVELVHCYSLIHDDLPAMDDDDLRRGRPTCHVAFDEATAILAGDALLTKAFEVLADGETHSDPAVCVELVRALAGAAGALVSAGFAISPVTDVEFLAKSFVICVIGGLGNITGALAGGLVLGLVENFGALYFGPGLQNALGYAVLLLVLFIRPTGLFGRAGYH